MQKNLGLFRSQLQKALNQLPTLRQGMGLLWKASPSNTVAWMVLLALQGVLPVGTVYLTRLLVNSLVVVIDDRSWVHTRQALVWVGLLAAVMLTGEILRSVAALVRSTQTDQVSDYIHNLIHQKSAAIDLAYYDSADYYDLLHRARSGASFRTLALLESAGTLLQNGITLVSMIFVLIPYGLGLPLALLVSTLPVFYVVMHHRLRMHRWYIENTPVERRAGYFDWLLTARENAPELRLFQLSDLFRSSFQDLRRQLREERLSLMRSRSRAEAGASVTALLITGSAMAWMIWRVMQGQFNLGDLALFYQAFNQGQNLMRSFLENVGEIYSNSLFLTDLFDFLALKPRIADPASPLPAPHSLVKGIQFDDVSFAYPDSTHQALEHFSLTIPSGQVAAIVGPNGAGKSTLLKLLCRFYDPQNGRILLDDVDLRSFAVDDLRARIGVLFQEPVQFSATVRENIALGDIQSARFGDRVELAAQEAGAEQLIHNLAENYETLLGKWFKGGIDLSVGEWQRIALARAFLRRAPIMILDEPTSAMDPWGETDWLRRFRKMVAGQTAIVITHRFTTAAFADIIHVMDQGKIIESGRHQELLSDGGRYAASWKEQMAGWFSPSG